MSTKITGLHSKTPALQVIAIILGNRYTYYLSLQNRNTLEEQDMSIIITFI